MTNESLNEFFSIIEDVQNKFYEWCNNVSNKENEDKYSLQIGGEHVIGEIRSSAIEKLKESIEGEFLNKIPKNDKGKLSWEEYKKVTDWSVCFLGSLGMPDVYISQAKYNTSEIISHLNWFKLKLESEIEKLKNI